MKGESFLLLGGATLFFLSKKRDVSPTTATTQVILDSPTGQAAGQNIARTFGSGFANDLGAAMLGSSTAGEVFNKLGYNPLAIETFNGVVAYNTDAVLATRTTNPYAGETNKQEIERKIRTAEAEIRRQDQYRKNGILSRSRQAKLDGLLKRVADLQAQLARL